jgi:hypothetical protein
VYCGKGFADKKEEGFIEKRMLSSIWLCKML